MSELMPIKSVAQMVAIRNNLLSYAAQIRVLKSKIDTEGIYLSEYLACSYTLERDHYDHKEAQKHIDMYAWLSLLSQNKITNAMTDKAKRDYEEKIRRDPPAFCETEIAAFAQNATRLYVESATQTFRDVFKEFTGCNYGDWHNPKKSNINFIAPTFRAGVGARMGYSGMELSHYNRSLQDLLTASRLADPDERDNKTLDQLMRDQREGKKGTDTYSTPYFTFQLFRNGNALVKWNPDKQHILDQINRFGASGELPDTLNRKYKPEHYTERKAA